MAKDTYIIDGFEFESKAVYEDAKKEYETVQYLKARTDLKNVNNVLKIYKKTIEKETFTTPIGYTFLRMLQQILIKEGVSEDLYPLVPISKDKGEKLVDIAKSSTLEEVNAKKMLSQIDDCKMKIKKFKIVSFFLVIIIIAMFIMTLTFDYTPYTDYKTKLENKYAGWEEDLTKREQELNQKETELNNR